MTEPGEVVVILGTGGMGVACAHRLGTGRTVVLADYAPDRVASLEATLHEAGQVVHGFHVDVADVESVRTLAQAAAGLGPLRAVVHTAGLSPTMATASRILEVDLLGTANVIEQFGLCVAAGSVGVFVASMAGSLVTLDAERERMLATAPTEELLAACALPESANPGEAYGVAKRGNQLRVQGAARAWGARGARIVSVSPGIIATPMGRQELESTESGDAMRYMLTTSPVPRIGTPGDIGGLVEWLVSPSSSFITGTDILIDGGMTAALRWGLPNGA